MDTATAPADRVDGAPAPPRRGRPPLIGRREEILDAAVEVMAERGVEGLSTKQLAEALGFSSYALTYHFGSRDQVLAAVAEHLETRLQAQFTDVAHRLERDDIGTVLHAYWCTVQQQPTSAAATRLWLEFVVLAGREPERFPTFVDRAVFGWRDAIKAALGDRPDADELATLVLGTVVGLEVLHTARPGGPDLAPALSVFANLITSSTH